MGDIAKSFAQNLRARRRALGMTQRELAERLGYSEKAISKWESGGSMPPAVMLPTLASLLTTTVDDLLAEEGEICYYLGIDGGGTKTEFLLADGNGTPIRRVLLGCCNPNDIGMEASLEVIGRGILEVTGEIPKRQISVFAGIAGSTTGDHHARIMSVLEKYRFAAIASDSDAKCAVAAALGREDGIAVIMGTGSIAFAQIRGESRRIGGHGYLLGDGGSGFALGRDAIDAALTDEDGCEPKTILRAMLHERLGGERIWDSVSELYRGGKRLIASYAPLVFDAVQAGDAVAEEILRKNMRAIARLIHGAAGQLTHMRVIPVVLCGGLTRESETWLPILREELGASICAYDIRLCERSMAEGALILAGLPMEDSMNHENEEINQRRFERC